MMETFSYPQFPAQHSHVHVALFTQVANSTSLRSRIMKAARMDGEQGVLEREAVNFAFVDAQLVTSILHLQTAIYQAVLAEIHGTLRTKTVHSEILWALNPTNNITDAIKRYGVSDATTALFVVRVSPPDLLGVSEKMNTAVTGDMVPLSVLDKITDWPTVRKLHKLDLEPGLKNAASDVSREHAAIDNIVTSFVAMKSVLS